MAIKSEEELMGLLENLEKSASLKKGDALEEAPHDGGLATEGENIQSSVAKKALAKILSKAGVEKAQADKVLKMLSASDMGSDEDDGEEEDTESMKSKKKSAYKSETAARRLAAASGELDEGEDFKKALQDEVPEAEEMVDASPFMKGLVDCNAKAVQSVRESVDELSKAMTAQKTHQQEVIVKIAKGLVRIADMVVGLDEKVEKVLAAPAPVRRALTVQKSDITQPNFGGPDAQAAKDAPDFDFSQSPLLNVPMLRIQEALVTKAERRQIDPMVVTNFELTRDFRALPREILKALETELC